MPEVMEIREGSASAWRTSKVACRTQGSSAPALGTDILQAMSTETLGR
jgi:hypothetical protein